MPESDDQDLINNLGDALRDVIDTYNTGHLIRVATLIGLLECIKHEILMDSYEYVEGDDSGGEVIDSDDFK